MPPVDNALQNPPQPEAKLCPFKFNRAYDARHCEGSACAWWSRGECSVQWLGHIEGAIGIIAEEGI